MKSTIALTLCHSHLPSVHVNTHAHGERERERRMRVHGILSSSFLFTTLILRIYCRGTAVIVHIKSRTVVSIHASFPHMVHIGMLNIHDPMKYTWRWRARLLHT